jgi:group I intron endonuclease
MDADPIPNASGIYRIIHIASGKPYIGSAMNLRKRRNGHFQDLRHGTHHSITLQRAWNKYGPDAFAFEILELVLVPELLTSREQYYFSKFRPFGSRGFNIARVAGSTLGMPAPNRDRKMTPEQLERHRLARIGKKASEETKRRMGDARRGRKHSLEARRKIGLGSLGKKKSAEAIEKRRQSMQGYRHSQETRAKISASSAGRLYPSRRKTLLVIAPDGCEYIVTGIVEFCKEHHLDTSSLMRVVRGEYSQHKGWTAHYP